MYQLLTGNEILGLPTDLVAHVLCGAFLYVVCRALNLSGAFSLGIVLGVALSKEALDNFLLTNGESEVESLLDISSTLIGGVGAVFLYRSLNRAPSWGHAYAFLFAWLLFHRPLFLQAGNQCQEIRLSAMPTKNCAADCPTLPFGEGRPEDALRVIHKQLGSAQPLALTVCEGFSPNRPCSQRQLFALGRKWHSETKRCRILLRSPENQKEELWVEEETLSYSVLRVQTPP